MNIILSGHRHIYEVESIILIFCANEHFTEVKEPVSKGVTIASRFKNGRMAAEIYDDGVLAENEYIDIEISCGKDLKIAAAITLFNMLSKKTGIQSNWGILTGIRPTKLIHKLWSKGLKNDAIVEYMHQKYLVAEDKAHICISVAESEREILKPRNEKTAALYIGIPFCPSRCLYCSFTSYPSDRYQDLIDKYLETLTLEMSYVKEYFKKNKLESIYIGGGTPTSLTEKQLYFLMKNVFDNFDIKNVREFSVEAGRPDTLNREKLRILKNFNVNRISINPQTMNDETLHRIGRNHTSEDFLQAFFMAREEDHKFINVDTILGLPGETEKEVELTMQRIGKLNPENLTVHVLAVKRASNLRNVLDNYSLTQYDELIKMQGISSSYCRDMKMHPYYLYRQKNMLGNLENVGYRKKGFNCIYNVQIMEECQTILALGAGGISKLVYGSENRVERIFNVKTPDEYINRIDEMLERKRRLLDE